MGTTVGCRICRPGTPCLVLDIFTNIGANNSQLHIAYIWARNPRNLLFALGNKSSWGFFSFACSEGGNVGLWMWYQSIYSKYFGGFCGVCNINVWAVLANILGHPQCLARYHGTLWLLGAHVAPVAAPPYPTGHTAGLPPLAVQAKVAATAPGAHPAALAQQQGQSTTGGWQPRRHPALQLALRQGWVGPWLACCGPLQPPVCAHTCLCLGVGGLPRGCSTPPLPYTVLTHCLPGAQPTAAQALVPPAKVWLQWHATTHQYPCTLGKQRHQRPHPQARPALVPSIA